MTRSATLGKSKTAVGYKLAKLQFWSSVILSESKTERADYVFGNRAVIDRYVEDNPFGMGAADLDQVAQWKEAVSGMFFVVDHTPLHTVLMADDSIGPSKNWGAVQFWGIFTLSLFFMIDLKLALEIGYPS